MEDLLQSDGWELFQRALGRKTERIGGVLAIEMPLPFGLRYWYAPRWSGELRVESGELLESVFLRAEFPSPLSTINYQLSTPRVMRRAAEPEWTWRTSLEGSDDERLAAMHEKHRYNVRLAQRRGVAVRAVRTEERCAPDAFWRLLQETAKRQGIATHPRSYYETMVQALPNVRLYIAEREGVPLAAAIVAYYGDTATYLHGGSSYEHRALMTPHLLHWQAMRDAKAAGMRWYDFGGIEPPKSAPSSELQATSWAGMTRFKQGFGGEVVHDPPTMDLVFRPNWYRLLSWMAKVRP